MAGKENAHRADASKVDPAGGKPPASPQADPLEGPGKGRILVVDDESWNRDLLHELLTADGHEVVQAESGEDALRKLPEIRPDVVILDVMMPGKDGYAICRELKQAPATAHVPVIMLTALNERADRLAGIEAGANDFLNKPVDRQEVILRVRNALYAKQLFDRVQDDLARLKELEDLRDNLVHMIVHDMRSPLMGIQWNLRMLTRQGKRPLDEDKKAEVLTRAEDISGQLMEMISSLLDVSRLEAGKMPLDLKQHDLCRLAAESVRSLGALAKDGQVFVKSPGEPVATECDARIVQRVIANLVANALKFVSESGKVVVAIDRCPEGARVAVSDDGPGVPEELHARIFDKFGQAGAGKGERGRYSTGLGLTFCRLAVEAHGGTIGLESKVGEGSTFWFALPPAPLHQDASRS